MPADDRPPPLHEAEKASGAWIPLSGVGTEFAGDLLVLYRSGGDLFTPADLQVLLSMAYRMYSAVEARERGAAIERLAQAGPGLARHLDVGSLLDDAVVLLRELTGTDSAWILTSATTCAEVAAAADVGDDATGAGRARPPTCPAGPGSSAGEPYAGARRTATDPLLLVPVMRDGEVIAVLAAQGRRARSFGKSVVEVAMVLASYLSAAISNGELYRPLNAREQELRRRATRDPLTGLANRMTAAPADRPDALTALADRRGRAAVLRPRQVQGGQRPARPRGRRRADPAGRPAAAQGRSAPATCSPGSAATSSCCCSTARRRPDRPHRGRPPDPARAGRPVPAARRAGRGRRRASAPCSAGGGTTTASAMLRDADAAMYVAKARGTGRLEVFDDEASHRSLDRLDLRSELSDALDRDQLVGASTSRSWS